MKDDLWTVLDVYNCNVTFRPIKCNNENNNSYEKCIKTLDNCIYKILVKGETEKGEILEIISPYLTDTIDHLKKICQVLYDGIAYGLSKLRKSIYKKYKKNILTIEKFNKIYKKFYSKYSSLNRDFWKVFKKSICSKKKNMLSIFFNHLYCYSIVTCQFKNADKKVKSYYEVISEILEIAHDPNQKYAIVNVIKINNKITNFINSGNPRKKLALLGESNIKTRIKFAIHENLIEVYITYINDLICKLCNDKKLTIENKKKIIHSIQYICIFCMNLSDNVVLYFIRKYKNKLSERLMNLNSNLKLESSLLQIDGFSQIKEEFVDMILMINDFNSSHIFNDLFENPDKISSEIEIIEKSDIYKNVDTSLIDWKKTKIYQLNYHSFGYLENEYYIEKINMPVELEYCVECSLKFSQLNWSVENLTIQYIYKYRIQKIIYELSYVPLTITLHSGEYIINMSLLQAAIYIYVNKNRGVINWKYIVEIMNVDENIIFPFMLSLVLIGIIRKDGDKLTINNNWVHQKKNGISIIKLVDTARRLIKEKIESEQQLHIRKKMEIQNECMAYILKILNIESMIDQKNIIDLILKEKICECYEGNIEQFVMECIELLVKDQTIIAIVEKDQIYFKIMEIYSSSESEFDD